MSRWRIAVIAVLFAGPALLLVGLGSYFLWIEGLGFLVWWPMAVCLACGYFLAWYWLRSRQLLPLPHVESPGHWTQIDLQAWKLVEQRVRGRRCWIRPNLSTCTFTWIRLKPWPWNWRKIYHPGTPDPYGPVTMPEILTVVELAAHDLAILLEQYVPASHLVTIAHFRQAQQAIGWYQKANALYWLIVCLVQSDRDRDSVCRFAFGATTTWNRVQENLVQWFLWLTSTSWATTHRPGERPLESRS